MAKYEKIDACDFAIRPFQAIGRDWCLITAGNEKDGANTLTACWGGLGYFWHEDTAFIFIRPSRYTYEFIEKTQAFSICFFESRYKEALAYLGSHSGRDGDKIAHENLHVLYVNDVPVFDEAYLAITCKNMYHLDLDPATIPKYQYERFYSKGDEKDDVHRLYFGKVTGVFKNVEREVLA
jgi:flavin reductase (DIM6/NTAB) family NADH-FMN oxidoreductase RutF